MAFGMRTYSSTGKVEIDTTSRTYKLLYSTVLDFNQMGSTTATIVVNVPGMVAGKTHVIFIPIADYDGNNSFVFIPDYYSINGDNITFNKFGAFGSIRINVITFG